MEMLARGYLPCHEFLMLVLDISEGILGCQKNSAYVILMFLLETVD